MTNLESLRNVNGNDGVRGPQSYFLYYWGIKQWNSLPSKVVNSSSVQEFKETLSVVWKDKKFEYD